jgi:hypothetical protein
MELRPTTTNDGAKDSTTKMLLPIKATLAMAAATAVADRTSPYVDLPSLIVVVFYPNVCAEEY